MSKTHPDHNNFATLLEKSGLSPTEASEQIGVSNRTIYRWIDGGSKPQAMAVKYLRDLIRSGNQQERRSSPDFKYIDLFAGIGGFRKAFDSINGHCVFTSEWDKNCRITYRANYPSEHDIAGDIRVYTTNSDALEQIPEHDVLVAGFPCQPFSIAGVSKKNSLGISHGFRCDTQGTLFFDLAQIIEHHKPKAFLLENVKNLISHDRGNTFKVIKRTLEEELGYHIEYKVIDARNWVPQHRERIFIVGFQKDYGFRFNGLNTPDQNPVLGSILHSDIEEDEAPYFLDGEVSEKYSLSQKLWEYLQEYKRKHQARGNGFGYSLFGPDGVARTLSARYHKDGSEILIKQSKMRPRRLTPRECARLMGFDGPFQSDFKIPVSDTQAYRQFGNSVVVPVAIAIAKLMHPYIIKTVNESINQLELPLTELTDG